LGQERLQKVLSKSGFGSRRDCEKLISAGQVKVNHQTAVLGIKVDPKQDIIAVNGRSISYSQPRDIFIAFNKPRKVLSDIKRTDDRSTVRNFIDVDDYLFIIGRLDYDSEGLILLTNNGDIANKLTHPRYEHEKEYMVQSSKVPDETQLKTWRRGVILDGGSRTKPAIVERLSNKKDDLWLKVILREGKKRQIREIGKTIGLPIKRIIRTRISSVYLGNLKPGEWRFLNQPEIDKLKSFTNQ
jgi:23S rRNA pseudouridine2605 synthase